jgi:uncharacterized membrane protein
MRRATRSNALLWVVQVLLALFFAVASGAPKLFLPAESLALPVPLPEALVRFIGVCEVLGALGLILPGVLRIRTGTTTVAAACLALLTVCATVYQLVANQPGSAVFAVAVGLICGTVAYARWRVVPLPTTTRPLTQATA